MDQQIETIGAQVETEQDANRINLLATVVEQIDDASRVSRVAAHAESVVDRSRIRRMALMIEYDLYAVDAYGPILQFIGLG